MGKIAISIVIIVLCICGGTLHISAISKEHPKTEFVSDGCSMWPDKWHKECCRDHDKQYWIGGTARDRAFSDDMLRQCVADISGDGIAWLMYYGVRTGGHPMFPVPWRWDFGQPYTGSYTDDKKK